MKNLKTRLHKWAVKVLCKEYLLVYGPRMDSPGKGLQNSRISSWINSTTNESYSDFTKPDLYF